MTNINKAREIKNDKSLDQLVRYSEGILSKREWLKMQLAKGAYVTTQEEPKYQWNRIKYNRMTCYKEQEAYEKKMKETKIGYSLKLPNQDIFWDITKTEYDYFQSLELAQDLNTERMDISERIEANIATEEEMNHLFGKDLEYFSKYAN
jgi:hypothetical protein